MIPPYDTLAKPFARAVSNDWVRIPVPIPGAALRLICLPHGGAGASTYFRWIHQFRRSNIEIASVQYPGHEDRDHEPFGESIAELASALAGCWPDISGDRPCAIFGHSLGAVIAYELAIRLATVQNLPKRIFVSGKNPPHVPLQIPPISHLPRDEFLSAITEMFGALPSDVLEDAAVAERVIRTLRADISLVERYRAPSSDPLVVPMSVFVGTRDRWTIHSRIHEWRQYGGQRTYIRSFEGDHFFIHTCEQQVVTAILDGLSAADVPGIRRYF